MTSYQALAGLGALGVLLSLGLALYITQAPWMQWQLLRAGDFAGLTELRERAVELRTLLKETAADRAWIAAQMHRTFATPQEAEAVLREIRSREQQIEQRLAKLADLRVTLNRGVPHPLTASARTLPASAGSCSNRAVLPLTRRPALEADA